MAFSANSSADNQGLNQCSYPSIRLTGHANYVPWKQEVVNIAQIHDMLGFLEGSLQKPREYDGSKAIVDPDDFERKCREWKTSDTLIKEWICGSLSEDVMRTVVDLETSNDVWKKLNTNYAEAPVPSPPLPVSSGTASTKKRGSRDHIQLSRFIIMGDWERASVLFQKDQNALTDKLNSDGDTPLHVAVGNPKNIVFLENLVEKIGPESLPKLLNDKQQNALHYAARIGNNTAAKKLIEKNSRLLFAADYQNCLPIHRAIFSSHVTTFQTLLKACYDHIDLSWEDGYHSPFEGAKGVSLLNNMILAGFLDDAYKLLKDYPDLATMKVHTSLPPLLCVAMMKDAFKSAKQYNLYQRFIYSCVPSNYGSDVDTHRVPDIESQETDHALANGAKNNLFPGMIGNTFKYLKTALVNVLQIKQIQSDKVKHDTALKVLKLICAKIGELEEGHFERYRAAVVVAVKNDTLEVVKEIIDTFPRAIWVRFNGKGISHLAIVNRCEKVCNFLAHEVDHEKYLHTICDDKDGNNLLHLAGQMAPTHKLNMVNGPVLQMQRELQWFQYVSKLLRPSAQESKNKKLETPIMVFRREHHAMRKEAEEGTRQAATSNSGIAIFIATLAFAAGTTVPGGNADDGVPNFKGETDFNIYAFSVAVALYVSLASLFINLSVLIPCHAEEDLALKLPRRLKRGLLTLFISVISFMIAFSASSMYIFPGGGKLWSLIGVLIVIPATAFLRSQWPLLVGLHSATGGGIF